MRQMQFMCELERRTPSWHTLRERGWSECKMCELLRAMMFRDKETRSVLRHSLLSNKKHFTIANQNVVRMYLSERFNDGLANRRICAVNADAYLL